MVHTDDDEFLALNTSNSQSKSTGSGESLLQFVDKLFYEYPKKVAIGFRQVSKVHCPTKNRGIHVYRHVHIYVQIYVNMSKCV
jgi:hypothetical protein